MRRVIVYVREKDTDRLERLLSKEGFDFERDKRSFEGYEWMYCDNCEEYVEVEKEDRSGFEETAYPLFEWLCSFCEKSFGYEFENK